MLAAIQDPKRAAFVPGLQQRAQFLASAAEGIRSANKLDMAQRQSDVLDALVKSGKITEPLPKDTTGAEREPSQKTPGVAEPAAPIVDQPVKNPKEAELVGMGAAVPSELTPTPQTPTGIKNATVEKERAARALPPALNRQRRGFGKVWDEAMAQIDHDPASQDNLIKELEDKPRALTDTEDALLLHRQIDLQNEYGKATRDLAQAYEDGRLDDVDREKQRVAGLSDKLLDLYNLNKRVGTESGRGLNARKNDGACRIFRWPRWNWENAR